MPEPTEQPLQPAAPEAADQAPAPAPLKKRVHKSPEDLALNRIKKRYRLDAVVKLDEIGNHGQPLGWGPLMSPDVFNKLAALDPTPDKRYLDWMIYQAGGGALALKTAREYWDDGTQETRPQEFFSRFHDEVQNRLSPADVSLVARELDLPRLTEASDELVNASQLLRGEAEKYRAYTKIIKSKKIAKGDDLDRVASDLVSLKLKHWIRKESDGCVRERVHAVFIFNRLFHQVAPQTAEAEWEKKSVELQREYVFGDQDALRLTLFALPRFWHERYQAVYTAVQQFLVNVSRIQRRNADIKQRRAGQNPVQRQIIDIDLDIGKIVQNKDGNLVYKGSYPTVESLNRVNETILDMPMRERVINDIRFATPKHQWGRDTKLYSDANLDMMVPLTVAASVQGGHKSWEISDPDQIKDANIRAVGGYHHSAWMATAAQSHNHAEWSGTQQIPVFFHIKTVQNAPERAIRILCMVFADDLIDLTPPYTDTYWHLQDGKKEETYPSVIRWLQKTLDPADYYATLRSLKKAMNVLREWGQGFDPSSLIGDYVAHHRKWLTGKRGLHEEVKLRAYQVVEELIA